MLAGGKRKKENRKRRRINLTRRRKLGDLIFTFLPSTVGLPESLLGEERTGQNQPHTVSILIIFLIIIADLPFLSVPIGTEQSRVCGRA